MNHRRRIQGTSITDWKDGIKLKKIRHRHIQGSSHRKLNKKKISSWFTRKRHVIEEENAPLESSMKNVLECTKPDSNRYHFTFFGNAEIACYIPFTKVQHNTNKIWY